MVKVTIFSSPTTFKKPIWFLRFTHGGAWCERTAWNMNHIDVMVQLLFSKISTWTLARHEPWFLQTCCVVLKSVETQVGLEFLSCKYIAVRIGFYYLSETWKKKLFWKMKGKENSFLYYCYKTLFRVQLISHQSVKYKCYVSMHFYLYINVQLCGEIRYPHTNSDENTRTKMTLVPTD